MLRWSCFNCSVSSMGTKTELLREGWVEEAFPRGKRYWCPDCYADYANSAEPEES